MLSQLSDRKMEGAKMNKRNDNLGLQELNFDEIESVAAGRNLSSREISIGAGVAGGIASAVGVGLAFSAAGPVGFAVGFGLGIGGVFLSSVGIGATLASK